MDKECRVRFIVMMTTKAAIRVMTTPKVMITVIMMTKSDYNDVFDD